MQHAVTGQAAFRSLGPMTDSPERRLNRIAGPNALPVLGRKIVERHQLLAVLLQAQGRLGVLGFIGFEEQVKRFLRLCLRLCLVVVARGAVVSFLYLVSLNQLSLLLHLLHHLVTLLFLLHLMMVMVMVMVMVWGWGW